ncbi:MAG: GNAT family N-acetyltransferase [Halodesulfurarchaeum sp.]
MYIREARNREEVWLLDQLEAFGFEDPAFRSRDYVFAVEENSGERVGFGRLRIHRTDEAEICELTNIGVLEEWQKQGAGAHIVKRLVENARREGFETVYGLTPQPGYLSQFGFEQISADALPPVLARRLERVLQNFESAEPTRLAVQDFTVPRRLRHRFSEDWQRDSEESPEDFGVDPKTATYKYDVDR